MIRVRSKAHYKEEVHRFMIHNTTSRVNDPEHGNHDAEGEDNTAVFGYMNSLCQPFATGSKIIHL